MSADFDIIYENMRSRRSIRRFLPDAVPSALLDQALDAMLCAPSASNRQNFRLYVIRSDSLRQEMVEAVKSACSQLQKSLRNDSSEISSYLDNFLLFGKAPVVVVPIHRLGSNLMNASLQDPAPEAHSPSLESISSVAASIMCFLLACNSLGLGACWMTGPLIAESSLRSLLKVPNGWGLSALIPVGFPAQSSNPPPKRNRAFMIKFFDDSSVPQGED